MPSFENEWSIMRGVLQRCSWHERLRQFGFWDSSYRWGRRDRNEEHDDYGGRKVSGEVANELIRSRPLRKKREKRSILEEVWFSMVNRLSVLLSNWVRVRWRIINGSTQCVSFCPIKLAVEALRTMARVIDSGRIPESNTAEWIEMTYSAGEKQQHRSQTSSCLNREDWFHRTGSVSASLAIRRSSATPGYTHSSDRKDPKSKSTPLNLFRRNLYGGNSLYPQSHAHGFYAERYPDIKFTSTMDY
ncbi:uncharacterized protein EI90DRAFT_3013525 [Cantharellus anzutake]|uniref:uncharacterized protein n=1 Tax=Cantharellus anzutake TaxID=1750568 RepID=UPI0019037948|nr:uncharacterized protein EI90DRAFT_3013525 [Cantharellus anzutake]KAF8338257.1 hypothetical protein EI90DRAFT_3013525 [Cantharellus anzutake]